MRFIHQLGDALYRGNRQNAILGNISSHIQEHFMKSTNGLSQIALSAALFAFSLTARANECPIRVGEYSGTVKAEWLTKTREMRLLEPFAFKGPDCKVWPVPKDAIVDGASIPQAFWTVIGGPFEGRYRDASVVHDYYCKVKTEPSDEVHKMFYHAMLANGVDSNKAGLMFYAVSWFGPKWQLFQKAPSAKNIYATGTDSDIRVIAVPDLKPSRELVKAMADTAGQPAPLMTGALATGSFKDRLNTSTGSGVKNWLFKEGVEVPTPSTIPLDRTAYFKTIKTRVEDIESSNSDEKFRLLNYGPSRLPSKAEVERLTNWIERAKPSLAELQKTPIEKIPE